jgi:hypothetical protein
VDCPGQPIMPMAKEGQSEMPDFEFTNPQGQKFTVHGPSDSTPEQAWTVLQQHLKGQRDLVRD